MLKNIFILLAHLLAFVTLFLAALRLWPALVIGAIVLGSAAATIWTKRAALVMVPAVTAAVVVLVLLGWAQAAVDNQGVRVPLRDGFPSPGLGVAVASACFCLSAVGWFLGKAVKRHFASNELATK